MITNRSEFSAAPSAAGYLYQARLALALCIPHVNAASSIDVAIERLDDIQFESDGTALELLQTKHHTNRTGSLSNSSPDLWKTLRIWAQLAAGEPSLPSRTRLVLVTTGFAPDGSAASLLRPQMAYPPGRGRDPKSARELLTEIASSSGNNSLKSAFSAFLALSPKMRASLLSAVEVVDGHYELSDLDVVLEESLRLVAPRGKAREARELLEGWWWPRICAALMKSPSDTISIAEIEAKMDDIRDTLKRDALNIEFDQAQPSVAEAAEYEGFRFVKQLKAVGIGGKRIGYAKRDYYRAFTQRSKWTREHVVLDGELDRFEATLIEEWQPRFTAMCDACDPEMSDEPTLKQAGQEIYQWVETEARFPFRSLTSRFLCVGSYHILANDLRVGWHKDYLELCSEMPE